VSLLKLSPESDRLRRLAKANAAGELDTDEYRRLRSEVIEAFRSEVDPDECEVTQRRAQTDVEAPTAAVPPAAGKRPRDRRPWRWLFGAFLLSLATLLAPAGDGAGDSVQRFCRGADASRDLACRAETVCRSDRERALTCPALVR
jgi:hypothetical protein